ncbi:MAG: hypothetical protein AAF797_14870 [Planctomycetota bacterium]
MNIRSPLTALALTATLGLAVGCGGDEPEAPALPADTTGQAASDAEALANEAQNTAEGAAPAADDPASILGMEPKDAIAKVESLITSNKISEAKALLDKLIAMKDQLPADLQAQIDGLASQLAGGNLPSLPGLGG